MLLLFVSICLLLNGSKRDAYIEEEVFHAFQSIVEGIKDFGLQDTAV